MAEEPTGERHWSDELPPEISREQWDEVQKELAEGVKIKERVRAIVSMCSLDERLARLLRTIMIDGKAVDVLMKDDRVLQSFSSRLKLAYALGLISEEVMKDLKYLNDIRNAFAHKAHITSFDQPRIRDLCGNLSTVNVERPDGETRWPPAEVHRMAVVKCAIYLDCEIARRAKKRASLEAPPANWIMSCVMADREQSKGSAAKKKVDTILTGDIPAHAEENLQAGG